MARVPEPDVRVPRQQALPALGLARQSESQEPQRAGGTVAHQVAQWRPPGPDAEPHRQPGVFHEAATELVVAVAEALGITVARREEQPVVLDAAAGEHDLPCPHLVLAATWRPHAHAGYDRCPRPGQELDRRRVEVGRHALAVHQLVAVRDAEPQRPGELDEERLDRVRVERPGVPAHVVCCEVASLLGRVHAAPPDGRGIVGVEGPGTDGPAVEPQPRPRLQRLAFHGGADTAP